jgi:Mg2+ and Co2+ transporter CorA
MLVGGAVVGVLGVVALISKGSSTTGSTTAAGSSINAALGSLQEEQMNLLGNVQAGALQNTANFAATSGQISDSTNQILGAITSQGTATQDQITGAINTINANTNSSNQGMMSVLTDYLNRLLGSQQDVLSAVNSVNSNVTQVGQAVGTVSGQVAGVSSQVATNAQQTQNGITAMLQSILGLSQQVNAVGQTASQTQAFTDAIGRFLGWEFYQIPNRYAAYIPNQGPGTYGGNVIGSV